MSDGLREYLKRKGARTLTKENCPALAEYDRAMREDVIPAIERDLKAARRAAHFARLGIPDPALAAGSRRAKTPKAVECEASQSGGEAVTPKTSHPSAKGRSE
jgi:hypothetical protein